MKKVYIQPKLREISIPSICLSNYSYNSAVTGGACEGQIPMGTDDNAWSNFN